MDKLQNIVSSNSDDETDLNNISFHVNKSGIPIDEATWDRLWKYAAKLNPSAKDKIYEIKNTGSSALPSYKVQIPPVLYPHANVHYKLRQIQNYLNALKYNHTGTQLFEIRKSRPIAGLMDTAKEMIKESLPIKCLEAVIVSMYLTKEITNIERFPIGFKSTFDGKCYYHIVLGVYHAGKFGALGLSRRKDLMDKPVVFETLYDLIENYIACYSKYTHILRKVRLGAAISRDTCSQERVIWTALSINILKISTEEVQKKLERFTRDLRSHVSYPLALSYSPAKSKYRPLPPRREKTVLHNGDKLLSFRKSYETNRSIKSASNANSVYRTKPFHERNYKPAMPEMKKLSKIKNT